ncbi:MAG: M50 family metallopeptidase [Candidatus Saccharimonadales bacterium]
MELTIGIIVGIVVLLFLVVVHELGHAIVAKRNGVKVKEFGVGFPPKATSKKVKQSFLGKNVEFSVNWLPIGGFVRLQGEYDSADKKGDYGAASYWVKTKILFAGVVMNWLVAAILLTILAIVGMPKILDNQFSIASDTRTVVERSAEITVVDVQEASPAATAGLQQGDKLKKVGNQTIETSDQVTQSLTEHAGGDVQIAVERDGELRTVIAKLRGESDKGLLGVSMTELRAQEKLYATWSAPLVGVGTTAQLTGATFQGIGDMVAKLATGAVDRFSADETVREQGSQKMGEVSEGVAGPIGILGVIFPQMSQAGVGAVLFLAAIVSLSLAVMNVLPIPALDGGRWFVTTIYKLRRKVLTREKEENIQATGMLVLLGLIVLITIADIGKVLR